MYKVNDNIIYGKMGVCIITDITVPKHLNNVNFQLYYVLKSLSDSCIIYTPVDTSVYMRPVISAEDADRLIDQIPTMSCEAYDEDSGKDLVRHYESALEMPSCEDLLKLTMSISAKKQVADHAGRKLGQIDRTFMKQAEDILFGELSLAFGIPKDQVSEYIAARVEDRERKLA
ncbi:CarD-like/TRCF domain protein [compost metagenome]